MTLWIVGAPGRVRSALIDSAKSLDEGVVVRDSVPLQDWCLGKDPLTLSRIRVANKTISELDIASHDSVIVTLGLMRAPAPGLLTASAAAITAMDPRRVVWVNRIGIGFSKRAVPNLSRWLLQAQMARSVDDRTDSDALILDAGDTVLHIHTPSRSQRRRPTRAQPLSRDQARSFPRRLSAADIASVSLELVSSRRLPGLYLAP